MPSIAVVRFTGVTPMLQSRYHDEPKLSKEQPDAYELRTWIKKAHTVDDENGEPISLAIPTDAFKKAIDALAVRRGDKLKGNRTYSKIFRSGFAPTGALVELNVGLDKVRCCKIFCSSTGNRDGTGTRVKRFFPEIPAGWQGDAEFMIVDDSITKEMFEMYAKEAGALIGVGAFRVENGGRSGRFNAEVISWEAM